MTEESAKTTNKKNSGLKDKKPKRRGKEKERKFK